MRPLELRLRNFRSYFGEDTVIDFRDRRLTGIVGPIGSGKSSILDALAFALYGRTPTVAANTRSLIHQRAEGATVALRFEVDGEVWEAVRALRRKGQSQHGLKHLATDAADAAVLETVTLEADVNARIVELLGLEFAAFSRSVLLAQGRFSEFLRSRPGERDSVLKGVFGHDRIDAMRAVAKQRVATLTATVEGLAARLEHVARLEAQVEARNAELGVVEDRIEAMRKAEPKLTDLADRLDRAGARFAELDASAQRLDELRGRLPDAVAVEAAVADAASAAAARDRLGAALADAQGVLATAEAALEESHAAGARETLEDAVALIASRGPLQRRVVEADERVAALQARSTAASARAANLETAVSEGAARLSFLTERQQVAEAGLQATEDALHEARHANMAAALRDSLAVGEPCPVCAQNVPALPHAASDVALHDLEETLAASRAAARDATDARAASAADLEATRSGLAAAATEVEAATREMNASATALAAARAELADADGLLTDLLGSGDPEELIAAFRERLNAAAATADEARKAVERVRREHDDAIRRQQAVAKDLGVYGMALVDLSARLDVVAPEIDDATPQTVGQALEGLIAAMDEISRREAIECEALVDESGAAREAQDGLLAALEVEGDFAAALAREEARAEWLATENASAAEEIAAATTLVRQRDEAQARRDLFTRLATDLTDAKFVRYLLDDERSRLAELGSDHFQRLSSGRYRFTTDGTFNIVDLTAADAVRKAESLSGGETFLASLGLALALAEMVSRSGGRLEAFFLDEGFGTLDPEHLDLAMEGIELLAAGAASRLVVIVSHVPELRHRLEDLIELDKSPVTGDTRVLRF